MSELPRPALPGRPGWPVTLDYGSIRLRALQRKDRRAWQQLRRDNGSWLEPWEPTQPPGTTSQPLSFSAMVRQQRQLGRAQRGLPWALSWIGDGADTLIGQVHVADIQQGAAQLAQLGYWIAQPMAGRGIMPVAVALAGDYCFEVLGLHRLEIAIRPENSSSLRVVEKLGFREEGQRRAYLHIDGAWRDHRVFSIVREECPQGLLSHCSEPCW